MKQENNGDGEKDDTTFQFMTDFTFFCISDRNSLREPKMQY